MQQAEVAGYKKFNQEFAKVAKPVVWDGPSTTGEKTQVVKNKAGPGSMYIKINHLISVIYSR